MKISLQATVLIGAILAFGALAVAITGFASLGDIPDPAQAADARGYAWFWAFLACVAAIFAGIAAWMIRTHPRDEDAENG